MAGDFLKLISGKIKEAVAIATSAGGGDAGKVVKTNGSGLVDNTFLPLDIDGTLAANSDALIATQKAVKTYVDALIATSDAMVFKGVIDASGNPNYPAADRGHVYKISVAGKIGGASGPNVEVGDTIICITDSTASGNHATVGAQWVIIQSNLDGAVIGPASATGDHFAQFDGTSGKLIKGGIALDTDGTLAANSDTRVPSQQAVKEYVDAGLLTVSGTQAVLTAGASLAPGDWVYIFDDSGTAKVGLADADDATKYAVGFVKETVDADDPVTVYFEGVNDELSGLTIGVSYFLSQTAGGETATPPTGAGVICQRLGVAIDETMILFNGADVLVEQVA